MQPTVPGGCQKSHKKGFIYNPSIFHVHTTNIPHKLMGVLSQSTKSTKIKLMGHHPTVRELGMHCSEI